MIRFIVPVVILLVWFICADIFKITPFFFPSLIDTLSKLNDFIIQGLMLEDIENTIIRWFTGFILACIVSIPIGLLIGYSEKAYISTNFLIDFCRSLPVTAIFPLYLIVFGIGDASKIAMVFTVVFFVVLLSAIYGVRYSSPLKKEMSILFGANEWQIFRYVIFYEAIPQIMIGIRLSISLSLIVVIVSEMFIGTEHGIGQMIFDSYQNNVIDELYATILIAGTLGYLLNVIFYNLEKKIIFWVGK